MSGFGRAVLYGFKLVKCILSFAFILYCNLVDFQMRTGVSWGHFTKLLNEFGFLRESAVAEGVVYGQNIISHIASPNKQ
jgi:hypothetical protein